MKKTLYINDESEGHVEFYKFGIEPKIGFQLKCDQEDDLIACCDLDIETAKLLAEDLLVAVHEMEKKYPNE